MDGTPGSRVLALIVHSPATRSAFAPGALYRPAPSPSRLLACIGGMAAVGIDTIAQPIDQVRRRFAGWGSGEEEQCFPQTLT